MDLQHRFKDEELEQIVEEATVYMCACPAQVASQIRQLRQLVRYQRECISEGLTPRQVHELIEVSSLSAHAVLEQCLDQVLDIEGWDRSTLKMPTGLRILRDQLIDRDQ